MNGLLRYLSCDTVLFIWNASISAVRIKRSGTKVLDLDTFAACSFDTFDFPRKYDI